VNCECSLFLLVLCGCALSHRQNMTKPEYDRNELWVSVHMYSHTIVVYFYIRIPKNLVNVGSSRHKLPRHRKSCVGDTDPSGQNWSDTVCRRRHVATCRRLFQLSRREGRNVQRVVRVHVPKTATATAHARNRLGRRSGDRQTEVG
jgi:hypothetical protein